ncbi:MAG: hypothetical protein ABSD87_09345 [Candidatus Acidiferrales bacterium]
MYEKQRSFRFRSILRSPGWLGPLALFVAACAYPADTVTSTVLIGNSRIDVSTEEGQLHAPKEDVMKWVQWSAEAVAGYYGRFPVPHTSLRIIPTSGAGVRGGRTWGDHGSHISIHVGADTTWSDFANDWMLPHEMIHLAFPDVDDRHHWIEEGISVYVEPFARVRAHHMDVNQMWFEVVRDMPKGLPGPGDEGLDHTHTWGRTYWGGALFCLLADIEIHEKTNNQKGLQDALRGILDAGGNIQQEWDLQKALEVGDRATGVAVLVPLYEEMKDQPHPVDLPAIWAKLGIERDGDKVRFLDSAPEAKIREAITWGATSSPPDAPKKSATLENLTIFAGRTTR